LQRGNYSIYEENKLRRDAFETAENKRLMQDIAHLESAAARTGRWSDAVEKTKYGGESGTGTVDRGYIGAKSAKMMKRAKATERRRERAIEEKSALLKNIDRADALKIHPLTFHADRLVECRNLSLFSGEKEVAGGVTFQVARGARVALTGKNGSGKSSVLKRILGEKIDYTGDLFIANRLIISYLPQDTSFLRGDLRSYANESGIDESLFKAILRKLDFERVQFEKDMADFSAGQRKKVAIAKSLSERAHLYIWDEPLNYIDLLSRIQIETLLNEFQPTMLFIEHDERFIEDIATEVVPL
jgi:lincosamide and streptogramin A transport system ATP-binding/permease protein